MEPKFYLQYKPLTSRPFLCGSSYAEYIPCEQLAPYIACFWESNSGNGTEDATNQEVLVIPDTCVDLIIKIYHTSQTIKSCLCGLADYPELIKQSPEEETVTTFAARFYFWSVRLFLDVDMRELHNQVFDFKLVDPKTFGELETFFYMSGTEERIAWIEEHLIKKLQKTMHKIHYSSNVYNSIHKILHASGSIPVKEICEYSCVGQRQMERLFLHNIGISLKRTSDLVRYQNVWRDIVRQNQFNIQNAVHSYGFADQSHLLHEFKRFHGVTPQQAKQIALKNR